MNNTEKYRLKKAQANGCATWAEWLILKKKMQDELYEREPWRRRMQSYYETVSKNNPEYIKRQSQRNRLRYNKKPIKFKKEFKQPAGTFQFEFVNKKALDAILGAASDS